MDGVILDSEPLHDRARRRLFKEFNITEDERLPDPVGASAPERWRLICELFHLDKDPIAIARYQFECVVEYVKEMNLPCTKGLIETLDEAKKRGITLALASSSPKWMVEEVLDYYGIIDYFKVIATADNVTKRKPDPQIYEFVLKKAGFKPEESAAIEDSQAGILSAKAARIYCFAYKGENAVWQDQSASDKVIHDLREIFER
jgi:HAD superfamily hydrolase (TIGR01509 family)